MPKMASLFLNSVLAKKVISAFSSGVALSDVGKFSGGSE
jgi:hypothetical protein